MGDYQAIPGFPASSNSPAKLAALAIPPLAGKKFLDVGCNAGYFCGYAFFDAAARVVGIDASIEAIARARKLFPFCTFVQGNWERLDELVPDDSFDVILCSSALHYAIDQGALVANLMRRLAPKGLLILEVGIFSDSVQTASTPIGNGWHSVKRDPDERIFPEWSTMLDMLASYAYKSMGKSVRQAGDPLPRYVFHVRHLQPQAVLLLGAPASGKTTLARNLMAGARHISGDNLLSSITEHGSGWPRLREIMAEGNWGRRLTTAISRICFQGALPEYAELVASEAAGADFVFEGYIPEDFRGRFATLLESCGYRVARLELPDPAFPPGELTSRARQEARKYQMFLEAYVSRTRRP